MGEYVTEIPGEEERKYMLNLHLRFGERDRKSEHSIPESLDHGRQLNVCSLNE